MKKTLIILSAYIIFISTSIAKENNYDAEIKKLQNQINELSKKVQETEIKQKNDLLDGFTINGRLHIVANYYNIDKELKSYNTGSQYNNDFAIKRARITIGKQIDDFLFNFEVNYKKDKIFLGENFIAYNLNDTMTLRIGQILTPSFMERERSSNTRASINYDSFIGEGWIPDDYLIGLNYAIRTEKFGISTGVFGNSTNNQGDLENDVDSDFLFRGYYTPLRNDIYTLHLGVDSSYRKFKTDASNNPDQIKNRFYYGLEFAFQYKYAIFTTEFIKLYHEYDKSRFNGNKFNFDGLYSELSVNFTGEKAVYNNYGCFGNIDVKNPLSKGGFGAIQGLVRYSFADGEDYSNGFLNNIGTSYSYAAGLNWIPENYFRILFGYSRNKITKKNYAAKGEYDSFKIETRMFF